MAEVARLQLLTRVGCHLCTTAAETLARIGGEADLVPEEVDVDTDPALQAEFGDRVPVVMLDGREHSYFTVDVVRLRRDLGLGGPRPGAEPAPRTGGGEGSLRWSPPQRGPNTAGQRPIGRRRLCSCVHKRLPWRR